MDTNRFDDLTRKLGSTVSRRQLLKAFAAGAVASLLPFGGNKSEDTLPQIGRTASAAESLPGAFARTWARTDKPVADGVLSRTWMWGPQSNTEPFYEPYFDAPGGERQVVYFDKSRMEDNSFRAEAPWDVTNGLLATELITGRMQIGDDVFQERWPAQVQVAGDDHPDSPTYALLNPLREQSAKAVGETLTDRLNADGSISSDSAFAGYGVTAAHYVAETDHTVASEFWAFMNSSGTVYEDGQFREASLFENPYFATGFPITEAYWAHVPVAGVHKDVLLQCFQRRCLTYTPDNPVGWQVEAGNIGQHYFRWRYEDANEEEEDDEEPAPENPCPDGRQHCGFNDSGRPICCPGRLKCCYLGSGEWRGCCPENTACCQSSTNPGSIGCCVPVACNQPQWIC